MTDHIHTCSYYCDRPECIKAQRDELRDMMFSKNSLIVKSTRNGVVRTKVGECEPNVQYRLVNIGSDL